MKFATERPQRLTTRERSAARKLAKEYFQTFPKDRYQAVLKADGCCNRPTLSLR
jgi:hypothetical protein